MCTNRKITLNSFLQELCPFLDFFSEILIFFFYTRNITKHIYLELINSNMIRGHAFKIKSSYSQLLAPARGALVYKFRVKC